MHNTLIHYAGHARGYSRLRQGLIIRVVGLNQNFIIFVGKPTSYQRNFVKKNNIMVTIQVNKFANLR